jgi:hypothetical protein
MSERKPKFYVLPRGEDLFPPLKKVCPACGAVEDEACSEPSAKGDGLGYELFRSVHAERLEE